MNYQVDDLTLDVGQRRVERDGKALDIGGLTFDLFQAIVEAAPNIISADELVKKVWSGRPTSPETITQRAMMLRQALGDSADAPRYIEVVRGQGFRLIPKLATPRPNDAVPKTNPMPIRALAAVIAILGAIVIFQFWSKQSNNEGSAAESSSSISSLAAQPIPIQRFSLDLDDLRRHVATGTSADLVISPDGRRIAYAAQFDELPSMIYTRELGEFESKVIPGTEGARRPFFSSDGEWIAFSGQDIDLLKVSVSGGPPQRVAAMNGRNFGNAWRDDLIVVSTAVTQNAMDSHLAEVNQNGGELTTLIPKSEDKAFVWPEILPTRHHVMFTTRLEGQPASSGSVSVIDRRTGEIKEVIKNAYRAKYAPSGHIVFGRDDGLWAANFDLETMQVTSDAVRIVNDLEVNTSFGDISYDFSDNGILVYVRGTTAVAQFASRKIAWLHRDRRLQVLNFEPNGYQYPRLSPNDSQVAMTIFTIEGDANIWTIDLANSKRTLVTVADGVDGRPLWTPDGKNIVYTDFANGGLSIRRADGTGGPTILNRAGDQRAETFTPDGERLIFRQVDSGTFNIRILAVNGDGAGEGEELLVAPNIIGFSSLSPDGKWLAYVSNETGELQVYVRPFPDVDSGRFVISANGGDEPRWSADGSELFYRTIDEFWSVPITYEPNFDSGEPELIATGDFLSYGQRPSYDVTGDGKRFFVFVPDGAEGDTPSSSIAVVTNWFEELERVLP